MASVSVSTLPGSALRALPVAVRGQGGSRRSARRADRAGRDANDGEGGQQPAALVRDLSSGVGGLGSWLSGRFCSWGLVVGCFTCLHPLAAPFRVLVCMPLVLAGIQGRKKTLLQHPSPPNPKTVLRHAQQKKHAITWGSVLASAHCRYTPEV